MPARYNVARWVTADTGDGQADRRTGRAHRVGGRPVVVFTSDPQAAVIELLSGRDARLWEARIEPLDAYALQ